MHKTLFFIVRHINVNDFVDFLPTQPLKMKESLLFILFWNILELECLVLFLKVQLNACYAYVHVIKKGTPSPGCITVLNWMPKLSCSGGSNPIYELSGWGRESTPETRPRFHCESPDRKWRHTPPPDFPWSPLVPPLPPPAFLSPLHRTQEAPTSRHSRMRALSLIEWILVLRNRSLMPFQEVIMHYILFSSYG